MSDISFKIAKVMQFESQMQRLNRDVDKLMSIAAQHGTAIKDLVQQASKSVSQAEFMSAITTTRFQNLNVVKSLKQEAKEDHMATTSGNVNPTRESLFDDSKDNELKQMRNQLTQMENNIFQSNFKKDMELKKIENEVKISRKDFYELKNYITALETKLEKFVSAVEENGISTNVTFVDPEKSKSQSPSPRKSSFLMDFSNVPVSPSVAPTLAPTAEDQSLVEEHDCNNYNDSDTEEVSKVVPPTISSLPQPEQQLPSDQVSLPAASVHTNSDRQESTVSTTPQDIQNQSTVASTVSSAVCSNKEGSRRSPVAVAESPLKLLPPPTGQRRQSQLPSPSNEHAEQVKAINQSTVRSPSVVSIVSVDRTRTSSPVPVSSSHMTVALPQPSHVFDPSAVTNDIMRQVKDLVEKTANSFQHSLNEQKQEIVATVHSDVQGFMRAHLGQIIAMKKVEDLSRHCSESTVFEVLNKLQSISIQKQKQTEMFRQFDEKTKESLKLLTEASRKQSIKGGRTQRINSKRSSVVSMKRPSQQVETLPSLPNTFKEEVSRDSESARPTSATDDTTASATAQRPMSRPHRPSITVPSHAAGGDVNDNKSSNTADNNGAQPRTARKASVRASKLLFEPIKRMDAATARQGKVLEDDSNSSSESDTDASKSNVPVSRTRKVSNSSGMRPSEIVSSSKKHARSESERDSNDRAMHGIDTLDGVFPSMSTIEPLPSVHFESSLDGSAFGVKAFIESTIKTVVADMNTRLESIDDHLSLANKNSSLLLSKVNALEQQIGIMQKKKSVRHLRVEQTEHLSSDQLSVLEPIFDALEETQVGMDEMMITVNALKSDMSKLAEPQKFAAFAKTPNSTHQSAGANPLANAESLQSQTDFDWAQIVSQLRHYETLFSNLYGKYEFVLAQLAIFADDKKFQVLQKNTRDRVSQLLSGLDRNKFSPSLMSEEAMAKLLASVSALADDRASKVTDEHLQQFRGEVDGLKGSVSMCLKLLERSISTQEMVSRFEEKQAVLRSPMRNRKLVTNAKPVDPERITISPRAIPSLMNGKYISDVRTGSARSAIDDVEDKLKIETSIQQKLLSDKVAAPPVRIATASSSRNAESVWLDASADDYSNSDSRKSIWYNDFGSTYKHSDPSDF